MCSSSVSQALVGTANPMTSQRRNKMSVSHAIFILHLPLFSPAPYSHAWTHPPTPSYTRLYLPTPTHYTPLSPYLPLYHVQSNIHYALLISFKPPLHHARSSSSYCTSYCPYIFPPLHECTHFNI